MRPAAVRVAVILALLLACPSPGVAQAACAPIAQLDSLYFAGDARGAWELATGPAGCARSDSERRWRAIRAAMALGTVEGDRADLNRWLDRGVELARTIREPGPPTTDEVYWSGAIVGRRALHTSRADAARLGSESQREMRLVLRVDSLHGGAHHGLGRIAYEVANLSFTDRLFGRIILGRDFPSGTSWENAEYHLTRAVELWPHEVAHHLDLGRLYWKRQRWDEAISALTAAQSTPLLHPWDTALKREAGELMDRVRREAAESGGRPD